MIYNRYIQRWLHRDHRDSKLYGRSITSYTSDELQLLTIRSSIVYRRIVYTCLCILCVVSIYISSMYSRYTSSIDDIHSRYSASIVGIEDKIVRSIEDRYNYDHSRVVDSSIDDSILLLSKSMDSEYREVYKIIYASELHTIDQYRVAHGMRPYGMTTMIQYMTHLYIYGRGSVPLLYSDDYKTYSIRPIQLRYRPTQLMLLCRLIVDECVHRSHGDMVVSIETVLRKYSKYTYDQYSSIYR